MSTYMSRVEDVLLEAQAFIGVVDDIRVLVKWDIAITSYIAHAVIEDSTAEEIGALRSRVRAILQAIVGAPDFAQALSAANYAGEVAHAAAYVHYSVHSFLSEEQKVKMFKDIL